MARKKSSVGTRASAARDAAVKRKKPEPKAALEAGEAASTAEESFPVVGIGASAGGLEAFMQMLQALPADTGMAFVFIQHLEPEHKSMLARLLSRATSMPLAEAKHGMAVEPNQVYVIPPNADIAIQGGVLQLVRRRKAPGRHMPVDYFLSSLAEDRRASAIGVILSGTASDGTLGLKAIKAEGGITFAQDEGSAKYSGMPRSAVATGCVDFVLTPAKIAAELARIARHPFLGIPQLVKAPELAPVAEDEFRRILFLLRSATGVDFTYYKPATIRRRIARRMALHKIETLKKYLDKLHEDRGEVAALYHDILIHVTSFFREREVFRALQSRVFPKIIAAKRPGEAIRVWVPGCSTGEEVYSIAIALLEHLGDRVSDTPVQIFGTDISEQAIEKARSGTYPDSSLEDVSAARLRRFFVKVEGGHQISKSVRDMCVFAKQDLTKDPPFSRLDLVSCRNVLIYLGQVLQKRILGVFHYALLDNGFLLLGKSESLSAYPEYFTLIDRKAKVYAKRAAVTHPGLDFTGLEVEKPVAAKRAAEEVAAALDLQKEVDRLVWNRYKHAGLIVDDAMEILHFRGDTSRYMAPAPGRASLHLLKMVRQELAFELRAAVHKARKDGAPVRREGVRVRDGAELRTVNLEVVPLVGGAAKERHLLVLFDEIPSGGAVASSPSAPRKEKRAPEDREAARLRQELAATKEYLQAIIEEQETTNEELKSANEEILSSNEELQSTNEELETAKEELQSTNEELVTLNEQLQNRNVELAQLGDDLNNVLTGVSIPILIAGRDGRIRRFTPAAEKLLNLLPADVGRPIGNIRPNLELLDLERLIAQVTEKLSELQREVQDREGRWYSLRIRPYRTSDHKIEGALVTFIDIDAVKRAEAALRAERDFVSAVLETATALVMVLGADGRIVSFNRACQRTSGYSLEEVKGRRPWEILVAPDEAEGVKALHRQLLAGECPTVEEHHWVAKDGQRRLIAWHTSVLRNEQAKTTYLIRSGLDVTTARQQEAALRRSQQLRELTAALMSAQEEERRRIARELHDEVNQSLARLAIETDSLRQQTPESGAATQDRAAGLLQHIHNLSDSLRRISYRLHPAALEHLGLAEALRAFCADFAEGHGIKVRFRQSHVPEPIPADVALCVYRVTQECLANVAKHSGTLAASVILTGTDGGIELAVSDRGAGFDIEGVKDKKGLGLISMAERARLTGGTLEVKTRPGDGARVELRIPLPPVAKPSGAQI